MSNNGVGIYKMVKGYIELWSFPSSRSLNIQNLFLPKREKSNREAQTFKCSPSVALAVLPLLSQFIQDVNGYDTDIIAYMVYIEVTLCKSMAQVGAHAPVLLGHLPVRKGLCLEPKKGPGQCNTVHNAMHIYRYV